MECCFGAVSASTVSSPAEQSGADSAGEEESDSCALAAPRAVALVLQTWLVSELCREWETGTGPGRSAGTGGADGTALSLGLLGVGGQKGTHVAFRKCVKVLG